MKINIVTLERDLPRFTVSDIADIIEHDWGAKVSYAARPYLSALHSLESVDDHYGLDDGRGIVLYFLANARNWRGDVARAVKAELKRRAK